MALLVVEMCSANHSGTHLVIALPATDMVVRIVILRTVSTKIEAMTGMLALEEVVTGMEVEGRHGTRIGATEVGQVLMTVQAEEGAHLHSSVIDRSGVCPPTVLLSVPFRLYA